MTTTEESTEAEGVTTVPADLAALIFEQLAPGERIAWCGQPRARSLVRGNCGFFIIDLVVGLLLGPTMVLLVALAFATIEFVARASFFTKEAFGVTILVCLPLPAIVLLCGALLRTRARAASTAYVVTDRQALIISTRPTRKIAPYAPADLTDARLRRRRGGMGDITLSRGPAAKANGPTWNIMWGVQDADRVMHLIRQTASGPGEGMAGG